MQILFTIFAIAVGLFALVMVYRRGRFRKVSREQYPVLYWIGYWVMTAFVIFYSVLIIRAFF